MTRLEATLREIAADLDQSEVEFALIGGLAVSARTEPRFTRDADLAVAVDNDTEAEALIRRLSASGYRIESLVEQDAVGRLATVRLTRANEVSAPVVDLLFASSGIEREIVHDAEALELLPGLTMRVAVTGDLVALKVLSRDDRERPQDLSDLRALLKVATRVDTERARQSLRLIVARGYNRRRDLLSELDALGIGS